MNRICFQVCIKIGSTEKNMQFPKQPSASHNFTLQIILFYAVNVITSVGLLLNVILTTE
jgi:hypothetical protein